MAEEQPHGERLTGRGSRLRRQGERVGQYAGQSAALRAQRLEHRRVAGRLHRPAQMSGAAAAPPASPILR
jgi:hypothetical protein